MGPLLAKPYVWETTPMTTHQHLNDTFEILVSELISDEELRDAFLRDPEGTLDPAGVWALPLSDSELRSLRIPANRVWDKVVDELEARLAVAA